jgi:hypothetical protein
MTGRCGIEATDSVNLEAAGQSKKSIHVILVMR